MLSKLERCDCTTQKGPMAASDASGSKSYLLIMCHLHAPITTTDIVFTFPNLLERFIFVQLCQNGCLICF